MGCFRRDTTSDTTTQPREPGKSVHARNQCTAASCAAQKVDARIARQLHALMAPNAFLRTSQDPSACAVVTGAERRFVEKVTMPSGPETVSGPAPASKVTVWPVTATVTRGAARRHSLADAGVGHLAA